MIMMMTFPSLERRGRRRSPAEYAGGGCLLPWQSGLALTPFERVVLSGIVRLMPGGQAIVPPTPVTITGASTPLSLRGAEQRSPEGSEGHEGLLWRTPSEGVLMEQSHALNN